jgi:uncharacterized protein YndB with AHSA1/START domain
VILRARVAASERARTQATAGQAHVERRNEIIEKEQSVEIHRPVGEVFAFLTDVENWALLQPPLWESERETSHGPMKVGDTFRQTLDIPSQRVELLCEVVEVEENERLSFEYTWDQLFLWIGLVVKPFDSGTRFTATGEGRVGGFLALFEPLAEKEVNAQLSTGLVDLKNLLESRTTNKK